MITFKEVTGPAQGRPRAKGEWQEAFGLMKVDPARDFTGLHMADMYLRSTNGGSNWSVVAEAAYAGPSIGYAWGGSHCPLAPRACGISAWPSHTRLASRHHDTQTPLNRLAAIELAANMYLGCRSKTLPSGSCRGAQTNRQRTAQTCRGSCAATPETQTRRTATCPAQSPGPPASKDATARVSTNQRLQK